MSSMYFWFYAMEQPLVGYLTDRLGPRRVVGIWTLIAAAGTVLFGLAPTIGWASAGRALVGLGAGGVYVPAMKAFALWFRDREFATTNGLMLGLGNMGAIAATTPLVWMAGLIGWRDSFVFIGAFTLGLAVAVFAVMRDSAATVGSPGEGPLPAAGQNPAITPALTFKVLTSLHFWFPVAMFMGVFGSFVTFQGLWATPYLISLFAMDRLLASELNMLIPLGFILCAPVSGWLLDRFSVDKIPVMIGLLILETALWVGLCFGRHVLGMWGMAALLLVLGGTCGALANTIWAWVRDITPRAIMGFTTGLINPSTFFGVAILQIVTGSILDQVGKVSGIYPPRAFQAALTVCLLITAACLFMALLLRKRLSASSVRGGRGSSPP
jgi:nitrate/nitrite transporter NarK